MAIQKTHNAAGQIVVAFVKTYLDTERAITSARGGQLTALAACMGKTPPISEAAYASDYAETVKAQIEASSLTQASKGFARSTIKVAMLALTHGADTAPEAGESLQAYVKRVRPILKVAGVLGETGSGPKKGKGGKGASGEGEGRAPRQPAAPEADDVIQGRQYVLDAFPDDAKSEGRAFIDQCEGDAMVAAALLIVADDDVTRAKVLRAVMLDHVQEFDQFAASILAAPAKTSRRGLRK